MHEDSPILNLLESRRFKSDGNRFRLELLTKLRATASGAAEHSLSSKGRSR